MAGIDVVVPCYQYGRFLRECVGSVLSQPVGGIRLLIIDNASTDDSADIARQLASEDSRIEVIVHQKNLGATASYNEGIEWASAEYFCILDADDLLAPGALRRALDVLGAHPQLSFCHGFEAVLLPDGTLRGAPDPGEGPEWEILSGQQFIERYCEFPTKGAGAPTVVRRTAAQKEAGYYRPELPYSDDVEMWLRLAAVGGVAYTGRTQGIRRMHPAQMSVSYRRSMVRDFKEREAAIASFFDNEGRRIPGASGLKAKARRRLGQQAYWSAVSHLVRGHVGDGARLLQYSASRSPLSLVVPPVGWLLRMDQPMKRIGDVLAESLHRVLPFKPKSMVSNAD
jgi:glycosyltransferase involved in cell wall biosynthesis